MRQSLLQGTQMFKMFHRLHQKTITVTICKNFAISTFARIKKWAQEMTCKKFKGSKLAKSQLRKLRN